MNELSRRMAGLAVLLDATVVALAGWLAWLARFGHLQPAPHYLLGLLLGVLLVLVLLPALGAYRGQRWLDPLPGMRRALPGLLATVTALIVLAAATKTTADYSRLWTGFWLIFTVALMGTWRAVTRSWLKRLGERRPARVLILGTGELARETARRLVAASGDDERVIGFLGIGDKEPQDLPAPFLGDIDNLQRVLDQLPVTEIWLAEGATDTALRKRIVEELQLASLPVRYVPDLTLLSLLSHTPRQIAGMTVVELNATPLDGPDAVLKAIMDRVVAALLLLMLSPLLLGVALLIRLDSPGPILFRQPRHGGDGRVFNVLKFRTMRDSGEDFSRQATRDDPRVTRIGRWLRSSSIDELPQLINVLRGEMSLVGPRPHPVSLNQEFAGKIEAFMQRHRVRPGITGWAQVHGYRGETDTLEKMRKRFEHDVYYIENWSLALDLRILVMTLLRGWRDRNAY